MRDRISTVLAVVTLLLPLLALGTMIARAEWQRREGTVVRVPITGYDPRDPLRGHYLAYRIDWNWQNGVQPRPDDTALCVLGRGDDPPVRPLAAGAAIPADCALTIRRDGTDKASFRPLGLSGQLFVDEQQAAPLQKALLAGRGKLTLDLAIAADGSARIRDWEADGSIFTAPEAP